MAEDSVQGDAPGRAGPVEMREYGTQGSSFRRSQVFGSTLRFHLLEKFNNFGAEERAQLVKCLLSTYED